MLYLLDADTLITADRDAYPLNRFPIFWDWLRYQGTLGLVKVPIEQFEEVTSGKGELVDWLCDPENKSELLLSDESDVELVGDTTIDGYGQLDEEGIAFVGRDPFLIAHARVGLGQRTVVTFEVSKPSKVGKNRKVPDVCKDFGVPCCTLYEVIKLLDFSTSWKP